MVSRFEIDSSLLSVAAAERRQGSSISIIASKRHATSFSPRSAPFIEKFISRSTAAAPQHADFAVFAIARESEGDERLVPGVPGRPTQYVRLTVGADGRCEAAADWREDDRADFERVTREIHSVVAPTLEAVNNMGAAAFPIGGELAVEPPRRGRAIGAITVSAFWPHAVTTAGFRELKSRFRLYERAGVIGVRGLQQAGAYTFAFRRGIVAYDPRQADRATRVSEDGIRRTRVGPANQYVWLSDTTSADRWAAAFQGRTVRIHHRATDLRVEILEASNLAEFEIIRRYVFSFLDGLLVGPDRLRVGEAARPGAAQPGVSQQPTSRRLRRLQERDPVLFDLKKHDPSSVVYSVLCQSSRQPSVYNEQEARQLGAKRRAGLVKYWNFTEGRPAFYECPAPKYPHLSLRSGLHPLGFCVPCCKKTRPAYGSRAALVNEECVRHKGKAPEEEDAAAVSRHVLTYGKQIPVGRLSDAPREVSEGLLLDAIPLPYSLKLIGVTQSSPAVPDAGYAYALAHATGIGSETSDEVFATLAATVAQMTDTFHSLGEGAAVVFASATDLADAILGSFVRRDEVLSPFSPGGTASGAWPAILTDLAGHAYGVAVVVASGSHPGSGHA
jgi:hypothetical protein